jgi:formamidopyrimidine-DNA glycosylase
MHDILFKAGLHPQKKISKMSKEDIKLLYSSILDILNLSVEKGTCHYEMDFFGQEGGYDLADFLVGYKENGEPCPVCKEPIITVKVAGSSTFICPVCQKL